MKARRSPVKLQTKRTPALAARPLVLGVDGGGSKTRAVVADGTGEVVLGEGLSGPSNPLRVGVGEAAGAIRDAVDRACAEAGVRRAEIVAAEVGLAGVKRADIRERMRAAVVELGIKTVEVVTDAHIALYGATEGKPGLVIIAGTGSICCGVNARGRRACAGGWGPVAGDEGSGSWIARRALQAVARATDGRGRKTSLVEAACDYFNMTAPDDLSTAVYAPNMTNTRIAGFGARVVEAAKRRDAVAREIVEEAGRELALAAAAVVRKLKMERERFQVAYVGGVFAAGDLILNSLSEELKRGAPRAFLAPPVLAPAEAAARMAGEHLQLALAG